MHQTGRDERGRTKDPVCGMWVDPQTAQFTATHEGETYYSAARVCQAKFRLTPNQYLKKEALVKDPVCGMSVDPAKAKWTAEYEGTTYYFCNPKCKEKFEQAPEQYLRRSQAGIPGVTEESGGDAAATGGDNKRSGGDAAATAVEYTCPMHPEIVQDHPGACPECGMALEPKTFSAEEVADPELTDMTRRFWISLILTVPLVAIAMGEHIPSQPLARLLPHQWANWVQFLLATPVVLWCGWPFFVRAWFSIQTRQLNMFTLIGLGVAAAWDLVSLPPLSRTFFRWLFATRQAWCLFILKRPQHYDAGLAGTGTRIACPAQYQRSDSRVAKSGTQYSACRAT